MLLRLMGVMQEIKLDYFTKLVRTGDMLSMPIVPIDGIDRTRLPAILDGSPGDGP